MDGNRELAIELLVKLKKIWTRVDKYLEVTGYGSHFLVDEIDALDVIVYRLLGLPKDYEGSLGFFDTVVFDFYKSELSISKTVQILEEGIQQLTE